MRILMAAAIAFVALIFAMPVLAGGSPDICQDAVLRNASAAHGAAHGRTQSATYDALTPAMPVGPLGAAERARQVQLHPDTPPLISCTAEFWSSF